MISVKSIGFNLYGSASVGYKKVISIDCLRIYYMMCGLVVGRIIIKFKFRMIFITKISTIQEEKVLI